MGKIKDYTISNQVKIPTEKGVSKNFFLMFAFPLLHITNVEVGVSSPIHNAKCFAIIGY